MCFPLGTRWPSVWSRPSCDSENGSGSVLAGDFCCIMSPSLSPLVSLLSLSNLKNFEHFLKKNMNEKNMEPLGLVTC